MQIKLRTDMNNTGEWCRAWWVMFNTNRAICQLSHVENKFIFNEVTIMYVFFYKNIGLRQELWKDRQLLLILCHNYRKTF
jgi:hypothetical protein